MSDINSKLLDVTIRIYAEVGYRGTTTRRIAADAGVNEVTLFRHFRSKDGIVKAAIAREKALVSAIAPDASNPDVQAALEAWALVYSAGVYAHRSLIHQLFADVTQHPEITLDPQDEVDMHEKAIVNYLSAKQRDGIFAADADCVAAGFLLISSLFTEALWRDRVPSQHCTAPDVLSRSVVAFVLRGLGMANVVPSPVIA